jgi:hypothetical protein
MGVSASFCAFSQNTLSVREWTILSDSWKNDLITIAASFYTLGTNIANHSKMDYDPYKSSYGRHVSGKWLDPPVVNISHDVNRQFNYWTNIIDHLAPARFKKTDGPLKEEAPEVLANKWVTAEEKMDEEYLRYVITEKQYGVRCAEDALKLIIKGESLLNRNDSYLGIYNLFYRTLLSAKLHQATATAYFGYRVYARGKTFQTEWLKETVSKALKDLIIIASEIDNYAIIVPAGQWNWRDDSKTAKEYYKKITETGWKEYGGVVFNL